MIRPGWLLASLVCAALLGIRAVWPTEDGRLWALFAEARFGGLSWSLLGDLTLLGAAAALPFAVLGALCRLAAGGWSGPRGGSVGIPAGLALAWLLAWAIVGLQAPPSWRVPTAVGLLLPGLGCVVGIVLGGAFVGSARRILPSLAARLAVLAVAAGLGLFATASMVLGESVPDAPAAAISSDEKRALIGELRQNNPFKLRGAARGRLEFRPAELGSLLAWGAQLFDEQARAAVRGEGDALAWLVSVRLPAGIGGRRQLTLAGELAAASGPGGLQVRHCELSAGTLVVAPWLCRSLLESLYRSMRTSREFGAVTDAIFMLRVDGAGLAASYTRPDVDAQARRHLQQALGPGAEIRAAALAQFDRLREGLPLPAGDDAFGAIVSAAFELARHRSEATSAVAQNQGAILALATVFGHPEVATLAGIERPGDWAKIRDAAGPVALRGREDWTRHFLVSAGLTQISTAVVSDAAGLLKEELDAARRSGFSFADLLADRAGTRFGELAARDEATARALQRALSDGFRVDHIMPDAADLPEGLTDDELTRRYGGVDGPGYQALVAEIEARVARLPEFAAGGLR